MSYTSEYKKSLAQQLLREAAAESSAEYAAMFQAEQQRLENERQAAISQVSEWAEAARQGVGVTSLHDSPSVRTTVPTPLNKLGIPVCHSTGQSEKCQATLNRSALDYPCHQCRWNAANMQDEGERWFE
jgi:hypothetical protein